MIYGRWMDKIKSTENFLEYEADYELLLRPILSPCQCSIIHERNNIRKGYIRKLSY